MQEELLEALEATRKVIEELSARVKESGRYDLAVPLLSAEVALLQALVVEHRRIIRQAIA